MFMIETISEQSNNLWKIRLGLIACVRGIYVKGAKEGLPSDNRMKPWSEPRAEEEAPQNRCW